MWRNWQTQQTQNLPMATSYGFESHHRHTASLTVSDQGSFFIVRPDFRISTACAADHRQKSLHTEFITVYRLFLSFYKSLYNCSTPKPVNKGNPLITLSLIDSDTIVVEITAS